MIVIITIHKSLAYVNMSWILVAHFTLQQLTIVSSTETKKYIHKSWGRQHWVTVLCLQPFLRSIYHQKASISLLVPGKSNIAFSNLLLDAVWCSSSFFSENMHLNDLNHVHVFFLLLALFSFDQNLFQFCSFLWKFFLQFCDFWYAPMAPWAKVNYHKISRGFGNLRFLQLHNKTLFVSIIVVKKLLVAYGRYRRRTVQEELSGHWFLIKLIDSTCVFIF